MSDGFCILWDDFISLLMFFLFSFSLCSLLFQSMVAAGFKGDERTLSHMLEGAARAADVRGAELIVSEMNKGRMKVTNTCLELLMRTYGRYEREMGG